MNEPTGREHLTPVRIKDTSATERAGFRQCRRRWFLTVVHRLDSQEGNPNFFVGNLVHGALEEFYRRVQGGASHPYATSKALDRYQSLYTAAMKELKAQLTFVWSVAEPMWKELGILGLEMVENYLEAEQHNPIFDEIEAVEFRVNVDIRNPKTGRRSGKLSVQADLVGRKDGMLKVVDHKTASRDIASAHLDIDDQLSAEVYSWWKDTGEFPEKAVYNVLYKKAPHPPRQVKGTKAEPVKLSKDKSQGTTYELYRQEIENLELDKANYTDMLAYLKNLDEMGENVFFAREETFRTPGQMAAFERDLYYEFDDMRLVAAEPERAYPNPTKFNCPGCPVRPICITIQDDGDVEAIVKAGYVITDPRR